MPSIRTHLLLWRILARAGTLIYAPVALLAFVLMAICAFSLLSKPRFDAESAVILCVVAAVLALSMRFSHPVFRLVTASLFVAATMEPIRDWGWRNYLADLADPRDMSDPMRGMAFTTAQLATMGFTLFGRAALGAARARRLARPPQ